MSRYEDLSVCGYFSAVDAELCAVGWLGAGHDIPTGTMQPADYEKLFTLLVEPWQPYAFCGRHRCEFCRFTGGPAGLDYAGMTVSSIGLNNLFVPGDKLYVAPSMIVHYIDAHGYCPPDAFLVAVRACPPMKSMAYFKALRAFGMRSALSHR